MRELIPELAREAGIGGADFDNGVRYYVGTQETFEQFAQLLVKECRRILIANGFDDASEYLQ